MDIGKYTGVFRRIFLVGGRGWEEGDMLGELSIENLSWEKKTSMKGEQDLLVLFKKKKLKNKCEKAFSAGSKEQQ